MAVANKRLFAKALGQATKPGPASLTASHMDYGGSRRFRNRWECSDGSGAGFCELYKDYRPTGDQFFEMLRQVLGVERV